MPSQIICISAKLIILYMFKYTVSAWQAYMCVYVCVCERAHACTQHGRHVIAGWGGGGAVTTDNFTNDKHTNKIVTLCFHRGSGVSMVKAANALHYCGDSDIIWSKYSLTFRIGVIWVVEAPQETSCTLYWATVHSMKHQSSLNGLKWVELGASLGDSESNRSVPNSHIVIALWLLCLLYCVKVKTIKGVKPIESLKEIPE